MEDLFFVHFICKHTKENLMCLVRGTNELSILMKEYDKERFMLLNIQFIGLVYLKEYSYFKKQDQSLVTGTKEEK
jgi:hypothetical protein